MIKTIFEPGVPASSPSGGRQKGDAAGTISERLESFSIIKSYGLA